MLFYVHLEGERDTVSEITLEKAHILQMAVKGHIMGCATSSHELKEIY